MVSSDVVRPLLLSLVPLGGGMVLFSSSLLEFFLGVSVFTFGAILYILFKYSPKYMGKYQQQTWFAGMIYIFGSSFMFILTAHLSILTEVTMPSEFYTYSNSIYYVLIGSLSGIAIGGIRPFLAQKSRGIFVISLASLLAFILFIHLSPFSSVVYVAILYFSYIVSMLYKKL